MVKINISDITIKMLHHLCLAPQSPLCCVFLFIHKMCDKYRNVTDAQVNINSSGTTAITQMSLPPSKHPYIHVAFKSWKQVQKPARLTCFVNSVSTLWQEQMRNQHTLVGESRDCCATSNPYFFLFPGNWGYHCFSVWQLAAPSMFSTPQLSAVLQSAKLLSVSL